MVNNLVRAFIVLHSLNYRLSFLAQNIFGIGRCFKHISSPLFQLTLNKKFGNWYPCSSWGCCSGERPGNTKLSQKLSKK